MTGTNGHNPPPEGRRIPSSEADHTPAPTGRMAGQPDSEAPAVWSSLGSWAGRVAAASFVIAMIGLWSYALFAPRSDHPDLLDDPEFSIAAEAICMDVRAQIDGLPKAHDTPDPLERSVVITQANMLLQSQVAQLRMVAPNSDRDGTLVSSWLDDWSTYIADRDIYAATLAIDPSARMLESSRGGDHISEALEGFAEANQMYSCGPPGDVA